MMKREEGKNLNEEKEEEKEEEERNEIKMAPKLRVRRKRRRMKIKEDNAKYLILSCCLVIVCFCIIPLIFVYNGSSDDSTNGAKVESSDANNTDDGDPNQDNGVTTSSIVGSSDNEGTPTSLAPISKIIEKKKTPCRDYYFPCEDSLDEKNDTICISRLFHCNQNIDCPNGEDERHCNYIPIDIKENFNFTKINLSKNSTFLQKYESNYHGNCSLFDLIQGKCVCHMDHKEKADCKNQGLNSIPNQFLPSITSLNLQGNQITVIDTQAINAYINLTIISLRYNLIEFIPPNAFYRLSKLTRLYLRGNRISLIDVHAFVGLSSLKYLYINENKIKRLDLNVFTQTPQLKLLDLAENLITFEFNQSFPYLDRIDWLDLSENKLDHLSNILLSNLPNLTKIHLNGNQITILDSDSFFKNVRLTEINLSNNLIQEFPKELFKSNTQLRTLNLEENSNVNQIPRKLFFPLKNLHSLNLTGITITNVVRGMFESNTNLSHFSDGVSSLQHLLIHSLLRISVWFVATITCLGNLTVIVWRSFSTKEDEVLSLFVKNLSVADLLMGIYLVAIGINDVTFADKYLESALGWMYSWKCTTIGILAMISSELSVLILTIVAIERYRSITFNSRLVTVTSARLLMVAAWIVSLFLALFPLINDYTSREIDIDTNDTNSDQVTGYYGSNGLCFPLHIDDPFSPGWKYSAFIFLGINFMAVVSMLVLYSRMFMVLSRDRSHSRPGCIDVSKEDMILAVRFFFIVLTDCLCWLPIVGIKFIAFTSQPIHPTIYAWVVVFILPINSALNPIIYTIAAPTSIRRIIHSKIRSLFLWFKVPKYCPCCPQSNFDETRSMADSTTTYMSEMLVVHKKRTSSDGSVISMALLSTPFLSTNGSRRTSAEFRRHSARSDICRLDSCRVGRIEFTRSDIERLDSGQSVDNGRIFQFPECPNQSLQRNERHPSFDFCRRPSSNRTDSLDDNQITNHTPESVTMTPLINVTSV